MLDSNLIQSLVNSFKNGKSIRRNLGLNSKIVIDQQLPFLCVYRFQKTPGPYVTSLIKTQGAYLIAHADLDISRLLQALITAGIEEFKSFMIVEVWNENSGKATKTIRIISPEKKLSPITTAMKKGFCEFKQALPAIKVIHEYQNERHPPALPPLLSLKQLQATGTLLIGLSIPAIFTNPGTNQSYPLFFRRIRRRFAEVLKVAAFEFIRLQAYKKFDHYLMLGKTRLDNLVRSADKKMADISEKMDFILSVSPVNTQKAWQQFKTNKYSVIPHFTYRLITLDPEIEKRKLFSIPVEKIEHPTLAFLFRDKRMELEKQLIMLEERGTPNFFHTSQSIYGKIDTVLKTVAESLLDDDIPNEQKEYASINASEFALLADSELGKYRKHFPQLNLTVKIKDTVNGLIVSGPELSIGSELNISRHRAEALIQHEVGTHMLTYCNGHLQPLSLMYAGFAGYEQLQEGLAVLAEFFVDGLNLNRLKLLAARVIAVDSLIDGADFIETYHILVKQYGFSSKTAFSITTRVYRGGGYTKDAIYLKGLLQLLNYIKEGGDINGLYAGKFALEHVPLVEELKHLRIIKKPVLPAYLTSDKAKAKLEQIKNGITIKELIT